MRRIRLIIIKSLKIRNNNTNNVIVYLEEKSSYINVWQIEISFATLSICFPDVTYIFSEEISIFGIPILISGKRV